MLHKDSVPLELFNITRQLMELESLRDFRLVGGTALALQLGHRESVDIDLFSSHFFPTEQIYSELIKIFKPDGAVYVAKDVMIGIKINGVKVDIVNHKNKFIRDVVVMDGIRMARLEEIAAMKIKTTCDPFFGRKTQKDLADIAVLLDRFSIKEMIGFFKEKYPTMAPYSENAIEHLSRDWDLAEKNSEMPKMHNDFTWETVQQKIRKRLDEFFDDLLKEREKILREKNKKNKHIKPPK